MFDYSVVDKVVKAIVDDVNPRMIVIFGSTANRTARKDSDLDIMVVMDTDRGFGHRNFPIQEALHKRRIHIDRDIFVVTPQEFSEGVDDEYSLVHEAYTTGVVAYEV